MKLTTADAKATESQLLELDAHLVLRSCIVGYDISPADIAVWGTIRGNKVAYGAIKKATMVNVSRWYRFIDERCPWIASAIQSTNAQAQAKKVAKSAEGASYGIGLPDTDKGVVTRFPPEPSYVSSSFRVRITLMGQKWILTYRSCQGCIVERLLCA